jgi:hypothetical protein
MDLHAGRFTTQSLNLIILVLRSLPMRNVKACKSMHSQTKKKKNLSFLHEYFIAESEKRQNDQPEPQHTP